MNSPRISIKISPKHINEHGKLEIACQVAALRAENHSWNEIAAVSPLSLSSIRRYAERDMSVGAQHSRQQHTRRQSLLTNDEKARVLEMAADARASGVAVNQKWSRITMLQVAGGRVTSISDAYITKFWSDAGWPSRKAQCRSIKEMRPNILEEILEFRNRVAAYVEEHQIPPARVYFMDEVGIWNCNGSTRTYVNPATNDASVLSIGDRTRDTGIVALSATGEVDAVFLTHVPQKSKIVDGRRIITQKGISGVGTLQMLEWSEGFCARHGSPEQRSILIMDRLAAHRGSDVANILRRNNIEPFFMPPQTARFLSPCDNSFFASIKARLKWMNTSTTSLKKSAFIELCRVYPRDIVRKYFTHCGWNF